MIIVWASGGSFLLDTVFSTCYDDVNVICPAPALCRGVETDRFHNPVIIEISSSYTYSPPTVQYRRSYDFKRGLDWLGSLFQLTRSQRYGVRFYDIVYELCDLYVSKKRNRKQCSRPWISPTMTRLRSRKRNLARRDGRDDEDSRALQVALDVIREWSNANGMNLNLSKCHVISFSLSLSPTRTIPME